MTALALALMFTVVATMVRWIEFRPQGNAEQLVIARFLRSSIVAVTDLRRVVIVEKLRLGQRKSLKVVLHTRAETTECEPEFQASVSQIDTEALRAWLTSQLGQRCADRRIHRRSDRGLCLGAFMSGPLTTAGARFADLVGLY
ncbi:hypothetical protein [Streptomyces goshikiensis]|uniref:hypothetical protein n=1 Tax=Streptomyces goshikiensis TaxID=1942 RepID=UPI003647756C